MIGVELFSGAGGMSLGAALAGVNVKFAVENDRDAVNTFKFNHPDTTVYDQDIRTLKRIAIAKDSKPTILFGGPPCQGFSTSNQRNRSAENANNWLFKEYVRLLAGWMPNWVVLENVKGLKETEGGLFLEEIISSFSSLGYKTTHAVLNAADFGVPQRRDRIFVVGSRDNIEFTFPEKTHEKSVTVSDALSDLPIIENGNNIGILPYSSPPMNEYAKFVRGDLKVVSNNIVTRNSQGVIDRYKYVPPGGNWESIPLELMHNYTDVSRCHTGIYKRLRLDEPSVVIGNFRKNMLIHPKYNRGLSVREAARIQSFPDNYVFTGSIGFQQQQVGNAVPPLLAKKVFESIMVHHE
ncbi:MAG: DNA cytosine methyltransferase [Flavobacteriales bacterium]|nr:DNA cytosine methyltransferase [Flavobacteriales bacterium]